jgi:hypothetical protein
MITDSRETQENRVKAKTDDKLIDIYLNAKDYQPEFIKLVEQELAYRKIPLATLQIIKDKKVEFSDETLARGIQGDRRYMVVCYIAAVLGGLISIVAGYVYAYSKHKNSKGEEIFVYNESTRKDGRQMLVIGSFVLALTLFFKYT